MLKNRLFLGVVLSVVLVTAGCGAPAAKTETGGAPPSSSSGGTEQSSPVTSQPASPSAPAQTAVATAQGSPDQGKQLFDSNCASCHALDDQKIVGPGLKGIYSKSALPNGQPVNDANLTEWMKTGDAQMPGNPALSAQDEANIISYLKTLK